MKRRIEENRWGRTARWNSSLSPLGPWVHLRAGMREIYPVIEGGRVAEKRHAFKGGEEEGGCIFHRRRCTQIRAASDHRVQRQTCNQAAGTQAIGGPPLSRKTDQASILAAADNQITSIFHPDICVYIYVYIFLSFLFIQIAPYYSVIDNLWLSSHGGLLLVGVRKMGGFLRGIFERGMWYRREEWIFEKESTF